MGRERNTGRKLEGDDSTKGIKVWKNGGEGAVLTRMRGRG
jgi:hypothetical protein